MKAITALIRTIELRGIAADASSAAKEVVTYQGLLYKVHDQGLKRVRMSLIQCPTEDNKWTAIAWSSGWVR